MSDAPIDSAEKLRAAILAIIERRPVSELPREDTYTLVDNGSEHSSPTRRARAIFKGGTWIKLNGEPLPFEPTFYVRFRL